MSKKGREISKHGKPNKRDSGSRKKKDSSLPMRNRRDRELNSKPNRNAKELKTSNYNGKSRSARDLPTRLSKKDTVLKRKRE